MGLNDSGWWVLFFWCGFVAFVDFFFFFFFFQCRFFALVGFFFFFNVGCYLGCTDAAPRPAHPRPTRRDAADRASVPRRTASCHVASPESGRRG